MIVFGPEGLSLAAMDDAMQAMADEARQVRGVALRLASAGGGFLGRVNQGYMYVRTVPHTERTVSLHRMWEGLKHGDPLAAFRGNYSQREVIAALRQRYRKFYAAGFRPQVRNIAGFNIGGGTFDIDLALRGPDLEKLAEYGETLKTKARAIGGIVDVDSTLQLDKPELRVVIDRARAGDLRVDTAQIATALRLMVGGDDQVSRFHDNDVNDDYDVSIRLIDAHRSDLGVISRLYVSRDSLSTNPATGAAAQLGLAPAGDPVPPPNPRQTAAPPPPPPRRRPGPPHELRRRARARPGCGPPDRTG